jgi:RHS repeat-associated protein
VGAPLLALLHDPDTGLVHLGAREYDPETGAFTRRDPSGLEGGENQYAYAGGDPVNYWDPDGNFVAAVVVGAAAGAAIGGAEGAVFGAADEVMDQAFDPGRTGFDCAAIRSAAGRGAAAGAAAGAVAGRWGRQPHGAARRSSRAPREAQPRETASPRRFENERSPRIPPRHASSVCERARAPRSITRPLVRTEAMRH